MPDLTPEHDGLVVYAVIVMLVLGFIIWRIKKNNGH
jgi:hypothetical protein